MANNSAITIKPQSSGDGHDHSAKAGSGSTAEKMKAASFVERAQQYAISQADCEEMQRENLAPRGGATIRMFPVCASGFSTGEPIEIAIGCDDLSGDISISPEIEEGEISTQCPGVKRTKVDGYTVTITIPVFMDRILANKDLLTALHQSEPVAQATSASGEVYEAFGITKAIFKRELPRFYVEIVPTEMAGGTELTSMLFFPYCMLMPMGGSLSFGRTTERTTELTLKATMPPSTMSGIEPVVSGIWRKR